MIDSKKMEELKQTLIKEKASLEKDLSRIARKEDGEYEPTFEDIGRSPEENAEEVEEYTANLGVAEALEKKLNEINEALERMEKGTYGKCQNCDQNIPLDRLKAYPAAKTCLDCAK